MVEQKTINQPQDKTVAIQLSFLKIDKQDWPWQYSFQQCESQKDPEEIPRKYISEFGANYPHIPGITSSFSSAEGWTIPQSRNKREVNEEWKAYAKAQQEIILQEDQKRSAVRNQAVTLIQKHIQEGLDLNEVRSFYKNNAIDLVPSKPYETYLQYAKDKNSEPMTLPQWAKLAVSEIFVSDLIPKISQGNAFQNSG